MAFVAMWMDLESFIQSEIGQKEKNEYHILTHICGIQENDRDDLTYKAEIETQMQRTTGKRGGMNWEIGIYTYTLFILCQKWITNENVLCSTESSCLMHCSDQNGEGNGTPLQYFCLENPMDGGAWQAAVHGVAKSQTQLNDFTFTFHIQALEKEMATHSSVLAWRIPGTGEPGGLPSVGSHRVGHD